MMQNKALIIDDNYSSVELLEEILEFEGFETISSYSAKCGLFKARSDFDIDIIFISLDLAKIHGLVLLKEIRKTLLTPVILIGSNTSLPKDSVMRYEASDFVSAPFENDEIVAKTLEVLIKQDYSCTGKIRPKVKLGVVELNNLRHTITINEKKIKLTTTEFLIIQLLMANYDHVVEKEQISKAVFKKPLGQHDRSIDTHISNIRKKIACHKTYDVIETIRGVGYLFFSGE